MKKFWIIFLLIFVFIEPVYAYIDPGTGSMMFSVVLCSITTLFFLLNSMFIKIKRLFFTDKNLALAKHNFVIYSEGRQYYCVFKQIADEFEKRKIPLMYYTSSEDDPIFDDKYEYVNREFIGKGNRAYLKLAFLNADICLMTTPQLDVLQLKRSKSVKHYSHILHSICFSMGYKLFGVDYYDSILCDAEFQIPLIREIEQKRNLPPKECVVVGSTYMDYYREKIDKTPQTKQEKTTIVVAPTWGDIGLLGQCGEELLNKLKDLDYEIIIRPHPQSLIVEKKLIDYLMNKFSNYKNIIWDFDKDHLKSLSKATTIISDYSSIMMDFAFLYDRPILCIKTEYNHETRDNGDLDVLPRCYSITNIIGREIDIKRGDIQNIKTIIEEVINNKEILESIKQEREYAWSNQGQAAKNVVDYLIKKQQELNN